MELPTFDLDFDTVPEISQGKLKSAQFLACQSTTTFLGTEGRFKINPAAASGESGMLEVLHLGNHAKPPMSEVEAEANVLTMGMAIEEGEFFFQSNSYYLEITNLEAFASMLIANEPDFYGIEMTPVDNNRMVFSSIQQPEQPR